MVREDILGGLKSAVQKGESLKQAMITFYNAGYSKEEIEEAARVLVSQGHIFQQAQQNVTQPNSSSKIDPTKLPPGQPIQKESNYGSNNSNQISSVQKISDYSSGKKKKGNGLIILLFILLAVLIGLLVLVIIFKDSILKFFS
jgi:hypothetical protein